MPFAYLHLVERPQTYFQPIQNSYLCTKGIVHIFFALSVFDDTSQNPIINALRI